MALRRAKDGVIEPDGAFAALVDLILVAHTVERERRAGGAMRRAGGCRKNPVLRVRERRVVPGSFADNGRRVIPVNGTY
jgi:hypothetical protein